MAWQLTVPVAGGGTHTFVTGDVANVRMWKERGDASIRPFDCSTCDDHGAFGPPHNASSRCQSGGRDHCTCDTCF